MGGNTKDTSASGNASVDITTVLYIAPDAPSEGKIVGAAAAASAVAGRALDLAAEERLEEILSITPGDPVFSG